MYFNILTIDPGIIETALLQPNRVIVFSKLDNA